MYFSPIFRLISHFPKNRINIDTKNKGKIMHLRIRRIVAFSETIMREKRKMFKIQIFGKKFNKFKNIRQPSSNFSSLKRTFTKITKKWKLPEIIKN